MFLLQSKKENQMQLYKRFYLLLLFTAGCGPFAKFISPDFTRPEAIAILPTINQTTDVDGAIVFRNLLFLAMQDEDYTVLLENEQVDSLLNLEGITDGGQLESVENQELFDILGVDGLLFIELLTCEYKTIGISETRKIEANFQLYKPPSQLIWEDEREVDKGKSAFGAIFGFLSNPKETLKVSSEDFKKQVAAKGVKMWLLEHELKPEMEEVINKTIQTLP